MAPPTARPESAAWYFDPATPHRCRQRGPADLDALAATRRDGTCWRTCRRENLHQARHDSACGMYQRSCAVLYPVKGTARNEHRRRPRGRGIMHPTFVKLFIETDADDLLAEEEA